MPYEKIATEKIPNAITTSKTKGGGKTLPIKMVVPRPSITNTNWNKRPDIASTIPPGFNGKKSNRTATPNTDDPIRKYSDFFTGLFIHMST